MLLAAFVLVVCCAGVAAVLGGVPLATIATHVGSVAVALLVARFAYVSQKSQPAPDELQDTRALRDRLALANIEMWEFDLATQRFDWSANRLPAMGMQSVPLDDCLGTIERHANPDDWAVVQSVIREAVLSGKDTCSYEYRFCREGVTSHLRNCVLIVRDADGKARRLVGTTTDVTAEVETREVLRQRASDERVMRDRLSVATAAAHIEVWEFDLRSAHFTWIVNRLPAYDLQDVPIAAYTEAWNDLVPAEDQLVIQQTVERAARGQQDDCTYRFRVVRDGQLYHMQAYARLERDSSGRLLHLRGATRDISDEVRTTELMAQQAEQERVLRDRLNVATRAAGIASWEMDLRNNKFLWRENWQLEPDQTGEAPVALVQKLVVDEDRDNFKNAVRAAIAAGTDKMEYRYRLRAPEGKVVHLQNHARLLFDAEGKPNSALGVSWDITKEVDAAREVLRAMTAAENANKAKSAFLANVSHEIRTPMNGIIGMSNLLLETSLDRTQHDYAHTIHSSAQALLTIINDILDFSKIEAGKLDVETLEFDVRETVDDVGAMLAYQAAAKHLELIVDVHPDVPARVLSDPQRIRQCLINLVGNAIKFTRAGEIQIGVRARKASDASLQLEFDVRDSGIGIDPATQHTLFQPFVQADSSTTRLFGGTGLGLSIVRRLVEMMGGEIGVDSELGVGSRFWFRLPLQQPANAAAPRLELTRLGRRVLVAVSNASARDVLVATLAHAGYDTSGAATATGALDLLFAAQASHRPYECLLLDRTLPDMDGEALAERVRKDASLDKIAHIMLSTVDHSPDVARLDSLGFAGSLSKPVRTPELLALLDRVLSGDSRPWHMGTRTIAAASVSAVSGSAARVLLVEDNLVNQKVAARFLERLGCKVQIANNGEEGVRAYRDGEFDIVFMDQQMPVMDGMTATRQIRALEAAGRARTPIVALTANAMTGQLDRCLAADMDAFLTKPLQPAQLQEVLDRFATNPMSSRSVDAGTPAIEIAPVDVVRFRELVGEDVEFGLELLAVFRSSSELAADEIAQALAASDRAALARAAHKLKGAGANVGATAVGSLATALESEASTASEARLGELGNAVRVAIPRTIEFLQQQLDVPDRAIAG